MDGRGRFRRWSVFQQAPYLGAVGCAPHSERDRSAPRISRLAERRSLVAGKERVDLSLALERLRTEYGVRRVRVDSGGRLNGALLRAGLVDEVHLLVCPWLAGGSSPRSSFVADDLAPGAHGTELERTAIEPFEDGAVLLSYRVTR